MSAVQSPPLTNLCSSAAQRGFGLLILEGLASDIPVAIDSVAGPFCVISSSGAGVLEGDFGTTVDRSLANPGARCHASVLNDPPIPG